MWSLFLLAQLLVLFTTKSFCASIWASYDSLCAQGCTTILEYLVFSGDGNITDAPCTNVLLAQSYYLCISDYCNAEVGEKYATSACSAEGYKAIPPSVIDSLTVTAIADLEVLTPVTFPPVHTVTEPVRFSEDLFRSGFRTISDWNHAVNTHATYGCVLIAFWVLVVTVGMTNRLLSFLKQNHTIYNGTQHHEGSAHASVTRTLSLRLWFRRVCVVPPRLETLTIAAFIIINFVFCFTGYRAFVGNLYWPKERWQLARYIADRTGVLAVANFPMLWLFAQRNNVLLWVTGWSFSTYNQFHRWVARIATLQAIAHSICWTVQEGVEFSGLGEIWTEYQWYTGVIATICMSLLVGLSVHQVRIWAYEVFLVIHILLAIGTIVGLYFHLNWWPAYRVFVWPCIAFWALDRILRFGRVALLWITSPSISAAATYHNGGDVITLNIPVSKRVAPQAGQFYYIYVLHGTKLWESHPFTLSTWGPTAKGRAEEKSDPSPEAVEKNGATSIVARTASSNTFPLPNTHAESSLSFVIRPYDSYTARLRDRVRKSSLETTPVRVLLEGPYGTALQLSQFNKVIFVVGGTGITIALSYLCQLYSQSVQSEKEVHIIWSIRQAAMLEAVMHQQNLALYLDHFRDGRLKIDVYNTSGSHTLDSGEKEMQITEQYRASSSEESISPAPSTPSINGKKESAVRATAQEALEVRGLTMHSGRPIISAVVQSLVISGEGSAGITDPVADTYRVGGKSCVVSCGPPAMSDETRKAVVDILGLPSKPDVTFLDEGFTW